MDSSDTTLKKALRNLQRETSLVRASPLAHLRRRLYDAVHRTNGYRGVYRTFREAVDAAPKVKPSGYNQVEAVSWYSNQISRIGDDDYPALFWIMKALQDSRTVFEIGGHIGVAFYGFARYLDHPEGMHWQICDVPVVIEEGRRIAAERGRSELSFVDNISASEGADIIFASGSLQYIETPNLADAIARFVHKPKHIIVNKTPVWDGPEFVTLQNLGPSYCPYCIRNRSEFVKSIEAQGYRLVDDWAKKRQFRVNWRRGYRFDHFSGFYFRKIS